MRKSFLAVVACLALMLTPVSVAGAGSTAWAQQAGGKPPACAPVSSPKQPPLKPTTITTIEQAYYCIFANYYSGPTLDDRILLAGAFAGFAQELESLGLDRADATLPALTGSRDSDWAAFSAVYQKVTGELSASAAHLQALAEATINAMVASLHDNHARWNHPRQQLPPGYVPGEDYGLGIATSPAAGLANDAPQEALSPLFVTSVTAGSPAARQGLRPGDVIESVNGAPPFVNGVLSSGAMNLLFSVGPVRLELYRPATGRTWALTLKPAAFKAATPAASARLLGRDIAYVELPGFFPGAASQVLHAIAALRKGRTLRGVILDLRGNGGGSPAETARLLGAFVHGKAFNYDCDSTGRCTANYTDDTVPLLHLPLTVLTDRNCASACDAFSSAVKDLRLGPLIGTRTSGIVAGPASAYVLGDGSILGFPAKHQLSTNHEIINGIGVAPDYYLPLTAKDLSNSRDPDITKALALLGQ